MIVSSEERRKRIDLYLGVGFMCGIFGFIIALPYISLPWHSVEKNDLTSSDTFLFAYSIFWAVIGFFVVYKWIWPKHRGTWHIQREGITFAPLNEPAIFISWDEVKDSKLETDQILVQGEKEKIVIYARDIPGKEFGEIRERIEKALRKDVNTKIAALSQAQKIPIILRLAILIALAIVGLLLVFGGWYIILWPLGSRLADSTGLVAILWLFVVTGLLIPLAFRVVFRILRKRKGGIKEKSGK